jgi:transcriptional regulator with XRE-family HTH domain
MNEFNRTRAKILGVLIRDARLHAGRTIEGCAKILHISADEFEQAELGNHVLSLPDIETLAMYLQVPVNHFWGEKVRGRYPRTEYGDILTERHKTIGDLIRQAREKQGRTIQEVAAEINASPPQIRAYEAGEKPIPLFELDRLARFLGHSLNFFIGDNQGPLAEHEAEQKIRQRLDELPPELRAFVSEPINLSYLEIAMRLSHMDVKSLRTIAENILNITF